MIDFCFLPDQQRTRELLDVPMLIGIHAAPMIREEGRDTAMRALSQLNGPTLHSKWCVLPMLVDLFSSVANTCINCLLFSRCQEDRHHLFDFEHFTAWCR